MNTKYETMSTDELGDYFSDFYKSVNGFRPRHINCNDRIAILKGLNSIDKHFSSMKETFAGRETLREEGWVIAETEPELIQRAKWLEQERNREMEVY